MTIIDMSDMMQYSEMLMRLDRYSDTCQARKRMGWSLDFDLPSPFESVRLGTVFSHGIAQDNLPHPHV